MYEPCLDSQLQTPIRRQPVPIPLQVASSPRSASRPAIGCRERAGRTRQREQRYA